MTSSTSPTFPGDYPGLGDDAESFSYRRLGPAAGNVLVRDSDFGTTNLAYLWEAESISHLTDEYRRFSVQIQRQVQHGFWRWIICDMSGNIIDVPRVDEVRENIFENDQNDSIEMEIQSDTDDEWTGDWGDQTIFAIDMQIVMPESPTSVIDSHAVFSDTAVMMSGISTMQI
jgi:hypothetical protein